MSTHTVIDIFAGAGGLSLGACRAGFSLVGAVELDRSALDTHRRNFRRTAHLAADVASLTGAALTATFALGSNAPLAGLIGGPPCQGFSVIGKNHSDDPRNSLFDDFFRLVADLQPSFFLAENVPGILHSKNVRVLDAALALVHRHYVVFPPLLATASDFGIPTTRRRVFFFGYLRRCPLPLSPSSFAPDPSVPKVYVRDALRGLPSRMGSSTRSDGWRTIRTQPRDYHYGSRLAGYVPSGVGDPTALRALRDRRVSGFLPTVHSPRVRRRYAAIPHGARDPVSKSHRLDPNGFCPTLRAGTGPDRGRFQAVRPLHPYEDRVINPREAARLQGFPDWFQFPSTKWHSFRCIGSSVSPILAEKLMVVVKTALDQAHDTRQE